MPLSSDAFNSSVMLWMAVPYICLATARIVEVLPVPGGPYSSKCGSRFSFVRRLTAGTKRGSAVAANVHGSVSPSLLCNVLDLTKQAHTKVALHLVSFMILRSTFRNSTMFSIGHKWPEAPGGPSRSTCESRDSSGSPFQTRVIMAVARNSIMSPAINQRLLTRVNDLFVRCYIIERFGPVLLYPWRIFAVNRKIER